MLVICDIMPDAGFDNMVITILTFTKERAGLLKSHVPCYNIDDLHTALWR